MTLRLRPFNTRGEPLASKNVGSVQYQSLLWRCFPMLDDFEADFEQACWEGFRNHWLLCEQCRTHDWTQEFQGLCREGRKVGEVWLIALDRLRESERVSA